MNKILYAQLALQSIIFLVGVILVPFIRSYFACMKEDIKAIKENMVSEKQCEERRESHEMLEKERTETIKKDVNGLGIRLNNFLNKNGMKGV